MLILEGISVAFILMLMFVVLFSTASRWTTRS